MIGNGCIVIARPKSIAYLTILAVFILTGCSSAVGTSPGRMVWLQDYSALRIIEPHVGKPEEFYWMVIPKRDGTHVIALPVVKYDTQGMPLVAMGIGVLYELDERGRIVRKSRL